MRRFRSRQIRKYVSGIQGCTIQAFPGATIGRLAEHVSSGRVDISSVDFVINNVGTNNVSSSQSVNTILSYYEDLIHQLKKVTSAKLIFTSILPRLVDHRDSEAKVCKVNAEINNICRRKHLLYCKLYRSFLYNNLPQIRVYMLLVMGFI